MFKGYQRDENREVEHLKCGNPPKVNLAENREVYGSVCIA